LFLTEDAAVLGERLERAGFLSPAPAGGAEWLPGQQALLAGGFVRARVVRFEQTQFVSSGQGGFRVLCPSDGRNATARFVPALEGWRRGGDRAVACGCGARHDLSAMTYRPECGFAREWLEFSDVGAADVLAPDALLDGVRVVWRRG
jgi:hypothetical protein